jgi:IclR family acetate operon transcriptional repressor
VPTREETNVGQRDDATDRPEPKRPGVPAVVHAMTIMRHFQEQVNEPQSMTEIARDLGINGSTCFNILRTLTDGALLAYDADTRRYRLGMGLVELASMVDSHGHLLQAAQVHAARVAKEVGQVCLILRKGGDDSFIVVGKAEGTGRLKVTASVGDRFPPNGAVLAKAFYAWCDPQEVEQMLTLHGLPARSDTSITGYLDFKKELEKTRARGYSTSLGEYFDGHNAVGTAVLTPAGDPALLLVVTGFASLITSKTMPFIGSRLTLAAEAVTRDVFGTTLRSLPRKTA